MHITNVTQSNNNKKSVKKNSSTITGAFSSMVATENVDSDSAAPSSITNINNLLFLQESQEDDTYKREAINYGFDILRYLEQMRINILSGTMSLESIKDLNSILQKFKKNFTDPHLSNIITEIELRAYVEIAKLEK